MARKGRQDRGVREYRLESGVLRYRVRLWRDHRPYKWSGFLTKTEARDWYEDRKRDIREGRPFPLRTDRGVASLTALIDAYLPKAQHKKNYSGECEYAAFWKGRLGTMAVLDITNKHIDDARSALLKVGSKRGPLSVSTVNRYVAWLRHVFEIEVDAGRLPVNPTRALKFREPNAPEVEYTEAEEMALARELGADADAVALSVLTGLRQGEQFRLPWSEIHLDRGYGMLQDPKGGQPQPFLINADAAVIFLRLKAQAGDSPWVFPLPSDPSQHVHPKSWYNNRFKPAAKRAGITISRKIGKTYHTLRHTFASRLQQRGVEVKDIKDLGRWASWKAMERYLKRDQSRLRGAIEKLTAPKPTILKVVGSEQEDVSVNKSTTEG